VVELYVKHLGSKVERPLKELKGFKRLFIKAGQTQHVTLRLKAEQLAYWNVEAHRFVIESERVELMIGASSADTKLSATVNITR
jgi:beta-glucosidase